MEQPQIEQLFDTSLYETELPEEMMGERPELTRDELIEIADQLVESGHEAEACHLIDNGFNNFTRSIGRAVLAGDLSAYDGYIAVIHYGEQPL